MRDDPLNTLSLIYSFANRALSKRFAGRDVSDSAKIEVLKLWLTFIRKVAQSALPPEYIVDQPEPDISPAEADAIAEEAEAIRTRAARIAAERDRKIN